MMTMAYNKRKGDELRSSAPKRQKVNVDSSKAGVNLFDGFVFFILPSEIQKARLQLFRSHVERYGGKLKDSATNDVTHIIVDDIMTAERVCKIMKSDTLPANKQILKTSWLSACFRQKNVVETEDFRIPMPSSNATNKSTGGDNFSSAVPNESPTKEFHSLNKDLSSNSYNQCPKVGFTRSAVKSRRDGGECDSDSDYRPSEDEATGSHSVQTDTGDRPSTSSDSTPNCRIQEKTMPVEKWICAHSSKAPKANFNQHITTKLEEMAKAYESTNDKWRAFGYQKAIAALRRYPRQITSWEEARSLQGVGSKLADKIWEIAQSGELRKLNEFQSSEQVRVLRLFTNVWGAGPTTANAWYQQGFRTLDDLKTRATLTHQQKVGVRLYEDLLDRMPREEAAMIEEVVREAAKSIQPGIIAQACGSYRRGKKDCGDVDILLTHPDGHSEKGLFGRLIQQLKATGFLTDDLVSVEDNGDQKKYLGVCKLPGQDRKHRRLDIIVVPYEEYACALVYFTGSAHFNRSLRHLCKKMGMSLNEHALRKGVVRKNNEKVFEGLIVPTPTEESVFAVLGVPYRPPEERDH